MDLDYQSPPPLLPRQTLIAHTLALTSCSLAVIPLCFVAYRYCLFHRYIHGPACNNFGLAMIACNIAGITFSSFATSRGSDAGILTLIMHCFVFALILAV